MHQQSNFKQPGHSVVLERAGKGACGAMDKWQACPVTVRAGSEGAKPQPELVTKGLEEAHDTCAAACHKRDGKHHRIITNVAPPLQPPCVLSSVLRYHACTCLRCVSGSLFASTCGVNSEVFAWPVKRSSCGVRSSNPPQLLYVGNLPHTIRERDIEDLFLKFGRIHSLDLKTPYRGAPFAFIEFDGACACLMW